MASDIISERVLAYESTWARVKGMHMIEEHAVNRLIVLPVCGNKGR
jgi:hypothetical protein